MKKYEDLIPILGITEVHEMRIQYALHNLCLFHEDLGRVIEWVARTSMELLSTDSTWNIKLGYALLDVQPNAEHWDMALNERSAEFV